MKFKLFALLALGIFLFGCLNTPADSGNVTNVSHNNVSVTPIKPVVLKPIKPISTIPQGKIDSRYIVATEFITSSPTYTFDGSNLTSLQGFRGDDCAPGYFELFGIGEQNPCTVMSQSAFYNNSVIYLFGFTSNHEGYGNREGQMVGEAVTEHKIMVMVKDNAVVTSIIDGKWDEKAQEMLPGSQ